MHAGKRCNGNPKSTKRWKLDRVAPVDNRPPQIKMGAQKSGGKWQNFISEGDKNKIFIQKVPFTLYPLFGLTHNSTSAKEQQKWASKFLQKKSVKVSFVTYGTEKNGKKGRGFSVFAHKEINE